MLEKESRLVQAPSLQPVRISMLGEFALRVGDAVVGDSSNRGHQVWNVLEYLVAFRQRDISNSELIQALWAEEGSENPASALKNLIYRIRIVLGDALPHGREMVVYQRGAYSWNNRLDTWVDVEEFERLLKAAQEECLPAGERVALYQQALALYRGDFLPKSAFEQWVVPLSTYYRRLYVKGVEQAVELLFALERVEEVVALCTSAIRIDQFEEKFHEALIHGYLLLGKQQQALQHYEQITNLFYRELGVCLSERLRSLYREIIKNVSHVEMDLQVIKEDLREAQQVQGAFFCEYEVFKNLYRLQARSAARSGQAVFIGMLTIVGENRLPPEKKLMNTGMEKLYAALLQSLRRGDVVSRFSPTQYVLMLSTLTYENGLMVLERICKRFKKDNPRIPLQISATLQPLDPVE